MLKIHNIVGISVFYFPWGNESTADDGALQHLSPKDVTESKWPSVEKDDNKLRYCVIYGQKIMIQAAHPQLMLINCS